MEILSKIQGLFPQPYNNTARKRNAVVLQNFITEGGVTLADFFVALPRRRVYAFSRASRNQLQGRSLKLGKILFQLSHNV